MTSDHMAAHHDHRTVTGAGAGGTVVADRSCIVYNGAGDVLHVHRRVTLSTGHPASDEELTSSAMELARTALAKRDVTGCQTLVVDTATMPAAGSLKVDPVALRLVGNTPRRETGTAG